MDLDKLVLTFTADNSQVTAALKKMERDAATSLKTIEGSVVKSGANITRDLARNTNSLQGQTGTIAAQFQDIAVQLQGGGSPFTIALQQGTQLSSILAGAGGLSGAVSALGAAFGSLFSPVSLITVGLIAAGGAALQYFTDSESEAENSKESLERHKEVIDRIRDAYGEAAEAAFNYQEASREGLQFEAAANAEQKLAEATAASRAFLESVSQINPQLAGEFERLDGALDPDKFQETADRFKEFAPAVEAFRQSVADGRPDIDTLLAQIRDMAEKNPEAARTLYELAEGLKTFAGAAREAAAAASLAKFDPAALARGAAQGKAYEALSGVYQLQAAGAGPVIRDPNAPLPPQDPRRGLENDPNTGRTISVPRSGGGGGRKAKPRDDFEDFKKRIAEQTQALDLQSQALQEFGGKADLARLYTEGLIAAQREGKPITEDLKNEVAGLVQKYGEGQVPIDQFKESQRGLNEAMAEINDTARSALGGFISDLRNGASAGEALKRVMDQLVDRSLDLVLDGLFPSAPNKDGSWGGLFGGLFKGLLGFADGGRPPVGRPSWVGERGRELFVPDTAGTIIPNHMIGGGGASPVIINADFRGAEAGAVTAINAKLEQLRSSIPSMIDFRARQAQVRGSRA